MRMVYIYLHENHKEFPTFMLGKYTVRPMDTMGYAYLGKSEHVPTPSSRVQPKQMVNWHPVTEPFGTQIGRSGIYV